MPRASDTTASRRKTAQAGKPPESNGKADAAAPRPFPADPTLIERLLVRVALLTRARRPRPLKRGGVSRSFLTELASELADDLAGYPTSADDASLFLFQLAHAAGLLTAREDGFDLDLMAADALFAHDAERRLQMLREAWLNSTALDELRALPDLEFTGDASNAAAGVTSICARARARIVACLADLPATRWTRLSAFDSKVRERIPDLLFSIVPAAAARRATYSGIRARGADADLLRDGNWALVEGALLERLVRLPLLALGYIDVGLLKESGEPAVRPAATREARPASAARPFIIDGAFEATVFLPEADAGALWRLARLCRQVSWTPQVARLKLDEHCVAVAVNIGGEVAALLHELESGSRTELAQNVRYTISEWARRARRVIIYLDAYLFEGEGIERADKLVSPAYRKRAALTPLLDGKHLVGAAAACPEPREGIAPRYPVLDYSRPLPPVIHARADGLLTCALEELNFRVLRVLSDFTERTSLEQFRVSRESLRATVQRGIAFAAILDQLRSVVKGELPPLLRARLLAWSERFGKVWIREERCLVFERRESALLLREDARAAELLDKPLNALAWRLDPASEAQARALLEELSLAPQTENDDAAVPRLGGDGELARVVHAPAKSEGPAVPATLAELWNADRAKALEYLTRRGDCAHFRLRPPRAENAPPATADEESVILAEPLTVIVSSGAACIEVRTRPDGVRRFLSFDEIVEVSV